MTRRYLESNIFDPDPSLFGMVREQEHLLPFEKYLVKVRDLELASKLLSAKFKLTKRSKLRV